jgi:hypothetical protein
MSFYGAKRRVVRVREVVDKLYRSPNAQFLVSESLDEYKDWGARRWFVIKVR